MLSKSKSFCFLVNVSGMAFLGNPFDKIMTPLLTPFHCGNLPFIKRGWSFIFLGGGGGNGFKNVGIQDFLLKIGAKGLMGVDLE